MLRHEPNFTLHLTHLVKYPKGKKKFWLKLCYTLQAINLKIQDYERYNK